MKILFFITGLNKSGAETQIYNLISGLLLKKNIEIRVISLTSGYYEEKLKKLGVEVKVCKGKLNYNIFKYISFFKNEVSDFKPDIVHSFLFHTNIISKVSLYFMEKKFKLICSYRDKISNHFWIKHLENFNKKKVDMLISNSKEANLDLDYLNSNVDKREVISNGFKITTPNMSKVQKIKKKYKGKKIILTIGRLEAQKDYLTNIKTCHELSKIRDDFLFLYVGEGSLRKKLESEVIKYKLEKFIVFLGFQNEVLELMKSAEVFFLPTLHESQSNVFIEAMSQSLPIVTTNIQENIDVVKNGIFCNIGDFKFMAEQIDTILSLGYNKKLLLENKKFTSKEFSYENMIKKYYKVYTIILR